MKKTVGFYLLFVLLSMVPSGCLDRGRLEAFLREPRSPVAGVEYIVLPPDTLSLSSLHITEINGILQQVRPDGKIVLPLLGEIYVAGKTPKEIEEAILEASGAYYKKADVTVVVSQYNSQKYYVFGQVSRPGPFRWTGCDTLLDVLAVSQPTNLAWPERIQITRAPQPTKGGYLVTGSEEEREKQEEEYEAAGLTEAGSNVIIVDLKRMIEKGDLSQNILLLPDDVVNVPPNPFAAVGLALQTVLFPTRPVIEAARMPYEVEYAVDPQKRYDRYRD
ncbi:MAG: Polysaccharide biosynthesis/export protein [Planctomycetes bacterium ADurb.Bin412]|nr:MAG: Polysaccharide biosynthesis/export protein [Planctomycetes bacterium ADurb.Bin412]